MAGVAVRHIVKAFGVTPVLRDVSLDIRPGEFMTLVGPSGCGKSTLLRIIAGLEFQDEGHIDIAGRSVDALPPKARDVAMVFQSYALYPYMTVRQNISLPLIMRRLTSTQRLPLLGRLMPATRAALRMIDDEVEHLAHSLDIAGLLDRKPSQLSGGQRQRVALGRAMVRHPTVFLMDEPLSNLDAKLRVQMRAEIADLHRRLGITFIYVTHDQAEAMTMSDRVAVMMDGELIQVAEPQTLYRDPQDRRVAEFIGSPKINMLSGRVLAGGVNVQATHLPLNCDAPVGSEVFVGLRPESFVLAQNATRGKFHGEIVFVENLGHECFVHVRIAGLGGSIVARFDAETELAKVGQSIALQPRLERALVFDATGRRVAQSRTMVLEAARG